VILDLACDYQVVGEDGEIPDDDAAFHCYATEREAEDAIRRWERREKDRRAYLAMGRHMRNQMKGETDPGCRALVDLLWPEPSDAGAKE
jgi:hypothetical protein